ncbi:MAG: fatty acyl-AMP ligase, partial [Myxococcales bacterium]|nr:fatty acyl-AMP ligase [Myxococcales bacterium]
LVFCQASNREIVQRLVERGVAAEAIQSVEEAFEGSAGRFEPPTIVPEDICFLQFTSGSTSRPKGVMVSHANLVANAQAFLGPEGLDRREEDKGVSWLPLFHDMGLIGFVLGTLICDIPVVLLPTETFARSPRLWLETIAKHRGTITYAPNFAYQLVTKRVKDKELADLDLSSLRIAGCGAEPIRAQTLLDFAEKFAPAGFDSKALLPSYGMAEATLAITFHPRGTEMVVDRVDAETMKTGLAAPASAQSQSALELVGNGRTFPGHEIAIVDDEGQPLGERRIGQVVARGPSITSGYFENPEATEESWREGWLQTGDLGYFADGHLFICGRIKDLIIVRGANHYPQDIEWVVGDMEGVRRGNVFAFGVIQDGVETLVLAAESVRADAERLRREIAERVVAEFGLAPAHVAMLPVGTLPKTSSGKAQRRRAMQMYEAGELEEHP